jgi:hypothetical protein
MVMFSCLCRRAAAAYSCTEITLGKDDMIRSTTQSLALAALLAAAAPSLAEDGIILPPGFDGLYAPEGLPCEGSPRIAVKDGVMVGEEFAITVTDLIEDPVNPRKVEATLLNQGGGGEWEDSAVLTLADDGQSLMFDYPDGTRNIWQRCG